MLMGPIKLIFNSKIALCFLKLVYPSRPDGIFNGNQWYFWIFKIFKAFLMTTDESTKQLLVK